MTEQAIWRGRAVRVLSVNTRTAVIVTPLEIKLQVRAAEVRAVEVRAAEVRAVDKKRKPRRDSRKF